MAEGGRLQAMILRRVLKEPPCSYEQHPIERTNVFFDISPTALQRRGDGI